MTAFEKKTTIPGLSPVEALLPIETLPEKIGPYKIESLLEKGGMSYVYLGTHPETKEPITIKVLSPKYMKHPEAVKRFSNEAEIITISDHPNIVKMYGHGEWEGGLYIAMEFIQGVSLRQYIQQTPLSLKRALEVLLEISYALCHLHTNGVIHRDLKPENILITEGGTIKVIDFGIAQLLTKKDEEESFYRHRVLGTPIYMSPEQRVNPESVTYPSDIYSLGIIAYELILGKLSHGHIHLANLPKGLQPIIAKTLQPKPEDRYHDIVDFITEISAYLTSEALTKDKKGTDQLSELSESALQAQILLLPRSFSKVPHLEIGVTHSRLIHPSGHLCQLFELPAERIAIVLAESPSKEIEGMIEISILFGMLRTISLRAANPLELMTEINQILMKEGQTLSVSYLLLSPQDNALQYCNTGYGSLLHTPAGYDSPAEIPSENPPLGKDPAPTFHIATQKWDLGDTLLLTSLPAKQELQQLLVEQLHLPPQKQVDALLRKSRATGDQPISLVSLLRVS